MCLGITQSWRARSLRAGFSGISLVPGGLPSWSRAPSTQRLPPCYRWTHAASEATGVPNADERTTISHGAQMADDAASRTRNDALTNAADGVDAEAATLTSMLTTERGQANGVDQARDALHTHETTRESPSPPPNLREGFRLWKESDRLPRPESEQAIWRRLAAVRRTQANSQNDSGAFRPKPENDSVLVAPVIKYKHPREATNNLNRYHKGLTRQMRLEAIRDIKGDPLTNWRSILEILRRRTRGLTGPWQKHGRKVSIPTELAEVLIYNPDHTIWDITDRTRCHIELLWSPDQSTEFSSPRPRLLLSGDEEALGHAVDEITRLARASGSNIMIEGHIGSRMSEKNIPEATSESMKGEEKIWNSLNKSQRPSDVPEFKLERRFDEIPVPKKWTPRTLEAYVMAVSKAKLPSPLASKLYGSGVAAKEATFDLLLKTFADPAGSQALSTRAFKIALHAMESHGHSYRHYARDLFEIMRRNQVPLDTGVFNIMLSGTVAVKDLRNFENVLYRMVRHNRMPNIDTWVLLLEMMENWNIRRHILKIMHMSGLLIDPEAARRVARALVVFDVRSHQATWRGLEHFLRAQEAGYGKNWASLASMNKLLNELGRLSHLEESCQLLDIMFDTYSIRPTTLSIKTVVYHARCHQRMEPAIAALRVAHRHKLPLDEDTYHELFRLCTLNRRSNAMGLVWLVACVKGRASWHMRKRVSKLVRLPGEPPLVGETPVVKNPGGAAQIYTLPQFHQDSHLDDLRKLENPQRRGALIGARLRTEYTGWRINGPPFHELLERALAVDNDIYTTAIKPVKLQQRQQQQSASKTRKHTLPAPFEQVSAPPPAPLPAPPPPPPPRRIAVREGIPLTLAHKELNGRWQQSTLPVRVLHLAPAEEQPPDEDKM